MSSNNNSPKVSRMEAKMRVKAIKRDVSTLIGNSQAMEGTMGERHETFGLFHKEELNLGKQLGNGGFCNVFELNDFTPNDDDDSCSFGEHQQAVRRFYRDTTKQHGGKLVVKQLRSDNTNDSTDFCMAAADLVVESQFLCSLNHKNILKIRGWSAGGINAYADGSHDGFFLILDRVYDTLDKRIESWRKQFRALQKRCTPQVLAIAKRHHMRRVTRIARQVADALDYLHSKGIVFRDLKPSNIGFDENGTVKLFDFGLAREMPEADSDDVYKMSGVAGTQRYMAPEVALSRKYNQKVDTYSWAMLYWSCLTLEKPYAGIDKTTHRSIVCKLGQRPSLDGGIPKSIQNLLKQSWAQDVGLRLTMPEAFERIERIETRLTHALGEEAVRNDGRTLLPESIVSSHTLVSMAA